MVFDSAIPSTDRPADRTGAPQQGIVENWINDLEKIVTGPKGKINIEPIEIAQATKKTDPGQDITKQKITLADINTLKEKVQNNDKIDGLNNTWQHGLDLKELGLKMIGYSQSHGLQSKPFQEGLEYLKRGTKTLENNLSTQPADQKQTSAILVTELMTDCGKLLAQPLANLTKEEAQTERRQADELFAHALKIAQDNKLPNFTRSTILQEKGNNMANIALVDLPINFTPEQSQTYQKAMELAMSTLKESLTLSETTEGKVRILNDMAVQESRRIKAPGDDYAKQTREYFKQSLTLLRDFDPEKEGKTPEERFQLTEKKDESMMKVLLSYRDIVDAELGAFRSFDQAKKQLTDREIAHRTTLPSERQNIQSEYTQVVRRRSERAKQLQK